MEIKYHLSRFYKWECFWLFFIVLATLCMHFFIISNPAELILDEQHYVNDARIIIANQETMRTEHPPLGKLFIVAGEYIFSGFKSPKEEAGTITNPVFSGSSETTATLDVSDASLFSRGKAIIIGRELMIVESVDASLNQITVKRGMGGTSAPSYDKQQTIYVFNDNPWAWRFFPILFGTIGIILFYFLCRKLDMPRDVSSIATFLLAFENMTFLMASVAMLDVFCVTLMIAGFLLYVCRRYINAGIAIGLSGLAKLNGALAGPVVLIHWVFSRRKRSWWFILTAFFAAVAFVELMIPLDYIITHNFTSMADPLQRIKSMLSMTGSLTFANVNHPSMSHPWDWLIFWRPMAFWIMPHYTACISFTAWALAVPSFGYCIYKAVKKSEAGLFGAAWFFGTYLLAIVLSIITDRVSYIFYFYPVIGSLCIGIALFLGDMLEFFRSRWYGKARWVAFSAVIAVLFLHLASFAILSPLIPVDFLAIYNSISAKINGFFTSWLF
jgi:predicted membrane-bound dolichyl-phosphate-mannose-protein mannosyltransferase